MENLILAHQVARAVALVICVERRTHIGGRFTSRFLIFATLLPPRARLLAVLLRGFPPTSTRGQFPPPLACPSRLVHLLAARYAQRIRRYIVRNRGARRHIRPVADLHRRDQNGIAPDEHAVPDRRRVLRKTVVIARDRSRADIRFRPDLRIANVGEGRHLAALPEQAL